MTDEKPFADAENAISAPAATEKLTPGGRPLRAVPAVVLLVLLALTRFVPAMVPMTFQIFLLRFFGPLVCCLLLTIWWLFASRAEKKERWGGFGLAVLICVLSMLAADSTLKGFGYLMHVIPVCVGAMTIALLLSSRLIPKSHVPAALLVGVVAFGYWDLIRLDGVWGDFTATFHWRWDPTAEELRMVGYVPHQYQSSEQDEAERVTLQKPEWSEFRGPHRDGSVPGVTLVTDWNAHPPKKVWQKRIGPGWSSFSVAGRRLFTQEQREDAEAIVALDRETGDEIWSQTTNARFWEAVAGAGPRATPTLHEGMLFTLGAEGKLQRLDPLDGKKVWERDIKSDANRSKNPIWGFSSSPLVVNSLVVVHAGGPESKGLLAYELETGQPQWSVACGENSYSSPQLAHVGDKELVLMLTNTGLIAVDPVSGQLVWNYEWKIANQRVLQPFVLSESEILVPSPGPEGTRKLQFKESAGVVFFLEDWTSRNLKPDFNDFVVLGGNLYGFDDTIFTCVSLETGKTRWKKGRYGKGQVLLLPDAAQLLVLSESGELILLRATPDNLEELARCQVLEGKTWNHPVLVKNHIYVRNAEQAACWELPTVD